jgi:F-type H+-transporting ATPase subunit alpha
LRLELAQYREKAAFAQFGSDLDIATQKQIARGQRLTEVLKQGQESPVEVERQVVVIYAATNGFLDRCPMNAIGDFEKKMLAFIEQKAPEVFTEIATQKKISDELFGRLKALLTDFERLQLG